MPPAPNQYTSREADKVSKKYHPPSPSFFHKAKEFAAAFNWPAGSFIIITHIIAVYALFASPFHPYTILLNIICWYIFTLALTAGYHRLWSHKTYSANRAVKIIFGLLGAAGFSMSVIDWVNDHRNHHKYTDTDKDPYNAKRGFWYTHIGWLMWKREINPIDIQDVTSDPFLVFQRNYFIQLAFLLGLVVPMMITGFGWGDWRGGFLIGVLRVVILHHTTFSINSWAHWGGDTIFSLRTTARENLWLALLTCGEGYHNFHHEFPNDYRNGIAWYAYDPTKWLIAALEILGLSWAVKRTSPDVIAKAEIQTRIAILEKKKEKFFWGRQIRSLPVYTLENIKKEVEEKKSELVIMDNIVYDVSGFLPIHPGGDKILRAYMGKDITKAFTGDVYSHSGSARNILDTLRVGVVVDEVRCQ